MFKTISACAAVLVAAALVAPTVSQADTTDSMSVSYADINLSNVAGQAQLQRRVANAADVVCAAGLSRDFAVMTADRTCTTGAISRAAPAVEAAIENYRRGTVEVLGAAAGITISAH